MISLIRLLLAPLALMGWTILYPEGCWAGLIPLLSAVFIFGYIWHVTSVRQKLVADFYFQKRHLAYGFFFSRIRLFIFGSIYALILSASLFLSATLWGPPHLGILAADAIIIFFLFHLTAAAAQRWLAVSEQNAPLVAKQVLSVLNTLILIGLFTWLAIDSAPPSYALDKSGPLEVMQAAASGSFSDCSVLNSAVSIARQVEGLKYYFLNLALSVSSRAEIQVISTLILLLAGGLPALAYSRLVLQLISGGSKQEATP